MASWPCDNCGEPVRDYQIHFCERTCERCGETYQQPIHMCASGLEQFTTTVRRFRQQLDSIRLPAGDGITDDTATFSRAGREEDMLQPWHDPVTKQEDVCACNPGRHSKFCHRYSGEPPVRPF
jgi:hypothetical protein